MKEERIGCVVMAAGSASRFGRNKLLEELDGRSLARRALDAVPAEDFDRVVVVTGYPEVRALAEERGFAWVWNDRPEEGLSRTVRLGLERLEDMDAALFMVCDQPLLTRESVSGLTAFYRAHPGHIVSMAFAGVRGNPCMFPAALFPELTALQGDAGGSAVIRRHEALLLLFEAADPAQLKDVDRPGDLPEQL